MGGGEFAKSLSPKWNKPGQPSVFPTEGGFLCSQGPSQEPNVLELFHLGTPRFLTRGGSTNIQESKKETFFL